MLDNVLSILQWLFYLFLIRALWYTLQLLLPFDVWGNLGSYEESKVLNNFFLVIQLISCKSSRFSPNDDKMNATLTLHPLCFPERSKPFLLIAMQVLRFSLRPVSEQLLWPGESDWQAWVTFPLLEAEHMSWDV